MKRRSRQTSPDGPIGSAVVGGLVIPPSLLARNPHLLAGVHTDARANQARPSTSRAVMARGVNQGTTALPVGTTAVRVERHPDTGAATMHLDGLRLTSHTNSRAHWSVGSGVAKRQRAMVAQAAAMLGAPVPLPCVVTITRCGGRALDTDNRDESAKHVRDAVALWLAPKRRADGVVVGDDGPSSPIVWRYEDEPGGAWGVRVVVEHGGPLAPEETKR